MLSSVFLWTFDVRVCDYFYHFYLLIFYLLTFSVFNGKNLVVLNLINRFLTSTSESFLKIVYKKTDEWYIEWQRETTNDNEWYNEWYNEWQQTNDKEWQRVIRNDNEWYNECQRVTIPANFFFFFQIKEKSTTKHPKKNFLNLEEDLWRRSIELRAATSTQKEILTVRSRNCRSSCSQIFSKIVFLKIFAIFSF